MRRIGMMKRQIKEIGAGDLVAKIAEPIAAALDATIGTKLKGCSACARRRKRLNKIRIRRKSITNHTFTKS